jgi:predicted transcriptional regulator
VKAGVNSDLVPETGRSIRELTLQDLFSDKLTDTSCVNIDNDREIWVATEMCAQYTESTVDSIVVLDDNKKNVTGTVGGYDLLNYIRKNPTLDSQYGTTVQEIMFKDIPLVEKQTKFKDLMENWQQTRRAFAIIPNESDNYFSPISARKMLEVGMRVKANFSISSVIKKKIVNFNLGDPLEKVLDLMFNNMTRKLVLEDSNQFISDRLILGEISRLLKTEESKENLLDIPASHLRLEHMSVVKDDLKLNDLCSIMDKSDHPYVMYKDTVVTPWDVCQILLSEESLSAYCRFCPYCGREI